MNIVKVPNSDYLFIQEEQIDVQTIIEQLANDRSSVFYIVSKGKTVGVLSIDDLRSMDYSLDKQYVVRVDHVPKSHEIIQYFNDNPTLSKLVTFKDGELCGEYRDTDKPSLSKTIYKNILCLKYVPFFAEELTRRLKEKQVDRVIIVGNEKISDYFKKYIDSVSFESIDRLGPSLSKDGHSLYLDFKYGPQLRRALGVEAIDLNDLLLKPAVDVLKKYLEEKGVDYYFVHDSVFAGIDRLSNEEKAIRSEKLSFQKLINDDVFLRKFCSTEEDYQYVMDRMFNKTSAFFNGPTIVQTSVQSKGLNVERGVRSSGAYPADYQREIHFYGPCFTFGLLGPDDYTFEYQLQRKFNEKGFQIRVFNHGIMAGNNAVNSIVECLLTDLRKGDIVFISFLEKEIVESVGGHLLRLADIMNASKSEDEIFFFDVPGHCNRKANAVFADYVFNMLKDNMDADDIGAGRAHPLLPIDTIDNQEILNPNILSHFIRLANSKEKLAKYEKIGSVTIYASPLTLGHMRLIEEALKSVDALVIFVVSDYFHSLPTLDRLEIVRKNYETNDRIVIIPTESYFASRQYFPEYSSKTMNGELNSMVFYQETIFNKYVADYLSIKYRFLGEETEDVVSKEYNSVVKMIAEQYGVSVVIFPRFVINGVKITGSKARDAIDEHNIEEMRKVLSDATINYLMENYYD